MPNIEVTPSLVHRDAADVEQVSTGIRDIATTLAGVEAGGNADFALTGVITQCAARWSADLATVATSVQNLSTKLDESATAMERTEETNLGLAGTLPAGGTEPGRSAP